MDNNIKIRNQIAKLNNLILANNIPKAFEIRIKCEYLEKIEEDQFKKLTDTLIELKALALPDVFNIYTEKDAIKDQYVIRLSRKDVKNENIGFKGNDSNS